MVMAFPFDRVFPGSATQAEVYEEVAHVVQSALDGYNVCIFAYGQTGSGKTFTMEGPPELDLGSPNDSQLGLIPRALQQVFMSAQKLQRTQHWEFTMVASYLEIYNENVRDLLSTHPRSNQASCQIKHKDGSTMLLLQDEQEKCAQLADSLRQSQEREAEKGQELQDADMIRRDLHNTLQESKGNIRVFCRVRPMLPSEEREGERPSHISFPDEKTVELVKPDTE
ncbi:carboxy-terminal kinesin 2-like isoform X2, partial [Ixodes scapularis]